MVYLILAILLWVSSIAFLSLWMKNHPVNYRGEKRPHDYRFWISIFSFLWGGICLLLYFWRWYVYSIRL